MLDTCHHKSRILEYQLLLGPTLNIYRLRASALRDHIMLSSLLTTIPPHELSPSLCRPFLRYYLRYHILCSLLQIVMRGYPQKMFLFTRVTKLVGPLEMSDLVFTALVKPSGKTQNDHFRSMIRPGSWCGIVHSVTFYSLFNPFSICCVATQNRKTS